MDIVFTFAILGLTIAVCIISERLSEYREKLFSTRRRLDYLESKLLDYFDYLESKLSKIEGEVSRNDSRRVM